VDETRWGSFQTKRETIESFKTALGLHHLDGRPLTDWLRRPHVRLDELLQQVAGLGEVAIAPEVVQAVEIDYRYAGYLERERRQIDRYKKLEEQAIPPSFNYAQISALRHEAREKFTRFRPRSLGQAARLSGISPADVATLSLYLVHRRRASTGSSS